MRPSTVLAAIAVSCLALLPSVASDGTADEWSHLRAAVDAPGRPEADRARDADRRPAQVLRFCGIRPGMRVAELMAGSGYYTEILSAAVGPEGRVYGHNSPFVLQRFAERPWSERLSRLPVDNVTRIDAEPEQPGLPEGLDAVLLIRFYHDFYWQEVDRDAVNRAVLQALRPGGAYCVLDHHAQSGSGDRDVRRLHRVDADLVKKEILAAGFEWDAESDVLGNPDDDRTWNIFADDAKRRDQTDRFLHRYRKPAGASSGAQRFLDGHISRGREFALAFAPDGQTMYLTRRTVTGEAREVELLVSDRTGDGWSEPRDIGFNSDHKDGDAFVAPDGSRLFFMSTRPVPGVESPPNDYDMWVVEATGEGGWSEPRHLGFPLNSIGTWDGFPTVSAGGALYFFSERAGGLGRSDVYRAEPDGEGYKKPTNLGAPINSEHWDGLAHIAPDESILIFASDRPGGHGGLDLYISRREGEGWGQPRNLGPAVNTEHPELFPHIDPQGRSFFFSRYYPDGARHIYVLPLAAAGLDR